MSIIKRGGCSSCGRTSVLIDWTNEWCRKCLDPVERKRCSRNALITIAVWVLGWAAYILFVYWMVK